MPVHSPAVKKRTIIAMAAVIAVAATACSSASADETTTTVALTTLPPVTTTEAPTTTTTSTTTTSTTTSTTTTTVVPLPQSPLNGVGVVEDLQDNLDRRVVAVKIDNHPDARPQSGLQEADAVYELLVEAGLTRFIALFLESDSEYVGPIRSLRPTDPTLVKPLDATLQISGGQAWVKSVARSYDVPYIGETQPNTFRIPRNGRATERTLFGTTLGMRERADRLGLSDEPPPMWFEFAEPTPTAGAATTVDLRWAAQTRVRWEWDGEHYVRFAGNEPHNWQDVEGNEEQVAFDTLLVLSARKYTARPSGSGSSVPALDTVGSGEATLFYDGGAVSATWQRSSADDPFELIAGDGSELVLPGGRLWISVFPTVGTLDWE